MKIDAHNHFWLYNAHDYDWIDDAMARLRADYTPQIFQSVLAEAGIDGSIAVQARQSLEETRWLLSLANANDFILGVIGWIDLCADDLEQQLTEFEANKKLKGFRHVLQGESDDFMLQAAFIDGVKLLAAKDYCYEILVVADQLPAVKKLLEQLPPMRLVINHIAKPDMAGHTSSAWYDDMREIAEHSHVFCKASGMVTEADWHNWSEGDISPYLNHVLDCFGSERLMFGSDWPVCLVAADYKRVEGLLIDHLAAHSRKEVDAIFGGNAQSFYRL
ncbi:MAG: amidohydrolase family protein [Pseudomonadales bacterium]